MFGPGVRPKIPESIIAGGSKDKWPQLEQEGPDEWRRSVYIFVKRSLLLPMMEGFDAPSPTQTCERRMTTTVSTQALVLLNDDFSNQQAEAMAGRVIREVGDDVNRQVERAYWLALFQAADRGASARCGAIRGTTVSGKSTASARPAREHGNQTPK